jgi:hypothetical protein
MLKSAWYKEQKKERRNRDECRDLGYCYTRLLRESIASTIEVVKKRLEKKTLFKIEMKSSFSSIDVFVKRLDRISEKLFDLHFKLKASPHGIFLMYGAVFKLQPDSPLAAPRVLYSTPERIDNKIRYSTIEEWIRVTTNINIQSLQLTENEVENEMKNRANGSSAKHRWHILLCHHFWSLLRYLGFV